MWLSSINFPQNYLPWKQIKSAKQHFPQQWTALNCFVHFSVRLQKKSLVCLGPFKIPRYSSSQVSKDNHKPTVFGANMALYLRQLAVHQQLIDFYNCFRRVTNFVSVEPNFNLSCVGGKILRLKQLLNSPLINLWSSFDRRQTVFTMVFKRKIWLLNGESDGQLLRGYPIVRITFCSFQDS